MVNCTVIKVQSAAPQNALWGGPGPGSRFEPGTGSLEEGTLTNRPTHLLLDNHTSILFQISGGIRIQNTDLKHCIYHV